jgi:hypothetical protein
MLERKHMIRLNDVFGSHFSVADESDASPDETRFWIIVAASCAIWVAAGFALVMLI